MSDNRVRWRENMDDLLVHWFDEGELAELTSEETEDLAQFNEDSLVNIPDEYVDVGSRGEYVQRFMDALTEWNRKEERQRPLREEENREIRIEKVHEIQKNQRSIDDHRSFFKPEKSANR